MRKFSLVLASLLAISTAPLAVNAATATVTGGNTTVLFGNGALETMGLEVTGIGGDAFIPGGLGPNSVGLPINSNTDPVNPTTFIYDGKSFIPFKGAFQHSGSIDLLGTTNVGTGLKVGNFTIAYDQTRVGDGRTGFYVADNIDLKEILFDLANPVIEAFDDNLQIAGDILVSAEFDKILLNGGFIKESLAGFDAGAALISANSSVVPVPAAVWLFGSALGLLGWVRRRNK